MKRLIVLLGICLGLCANVGAQQPQRFSSASSVVDSTKVSIPATYDYTYEEQMVEGGDGYKLMTCIYKPVGEGPWPVVILRTPYVYGTGDNNANARFYARRGIVYIVQHCRGKGGSEGPYEPNVNERVDGLALVNWVANQPWCKNIGLFGESYTALTCWIIADAVPEKVKGIYIHHYGVDRHLSAYSNGLFRQDILTAWSIDNAVEIPKKPERKDPQRIYFEQMKYMPQLEMDRHFFGVMLPWYRDWISYTDYTDPYWHQGVWETLRQIPAKIKVPIVVVAGHFDHHQEGTILGYNLLPEETKAKSRLIVGAWNHSHIITPQIGKFDHATDINLTTDQFLWFYDLLVREQTPKPDVQVYAIGEDKWHQLDEWPLNHPSATQTYFLSSQREGKGYHLSATPEAQTGTIRYAYDPQNPVESIGGETLFNSGTRRGSQLQPEVGYRDDVISFVSEPLEAPLLLAGKVKVTLHVSSDCDDTAFSYKISEEMADGKTYNIRTGITSLSFRNNPLGDRQSYTPGEVVEVTVEALPIMWQLSTGSRIRVDISSSDFPQYSVHSNYAGVWSRQTKTRVAHQTLYTGDEYGSRIEIPLIR
ncbi:MAG: CocE/NonD family hydrolase [Bacteroidaceae bacterium]|nr:CocE/NonD family hydrolase [Bacteroidaceae bacterium]MBQ9498562.1 CocE/NonD family hydrolase [Bacteroidaceae bacterium]